jgi:hypothetical protein
MPGVQVLTQHNDNARTGANLAESILIPDAVSAPGRFGKRFEWQVEGHVYAQPLYVPNVAFPEGQRNAVYVATMHNVVYAFDADAPQASGPIWKQSLGPFVPLPDPGIGPQPLPGQPPIYKDIADAVGIVSTPVISLQQNVIYVVALTREGTEYRLRLHALDLADGTEKLGGPVVVEGSVVGTGVGSAGGRITFTSNLQIQRPGLLLSGSTLYVAFASYGDAGPYHGWVFGFDALTLQQRPRIYNTSRFGERGGIWMAGQGPASDQAGAVYCLTGNGTFAEAGFAISDKVVLPETAIGGPALADCGGTALGIAWTSPDQRLNFARSTTGSGSSFTGKVTLPESSIDGPALAFGNGRVFLAWTGTDTPHHLNSVSSTDLSTFGGKVTLPLGETSNQGPALAFGNGKLFLAWTGLDQRLMVSSSGDGVTFSPAVRLAHTSSTSPGLLFANGRLFLVWRGTEAGGHLNVIDSVDGVTFANKVTLPEASAFRPAFASLDGMCLAWTGLAPGRNINVRTGPTPATLANKQTFSDSSQASPALVAFKGGLRLSWSGTDAPAHLNLATLSSQDEPSLGDSFVKLAPDLSLSDWFSPWNTQQLNAADTDLGSGGILLLPGTSLVVGGGKEGKLYLLDAGHLGNFCATCHDPAGDTQIVEWFQATGTNQGITPPPPGTHHIHGSPVFWNSRSGGPRIYVWGEADWLRAFRFNGAKFDVAPVDISDITTPPNSMPGGILSISAQGDQDGTGIIWASHPIHDNANQAVVDGMLQAIDAGNLKRVLWNSTSNPADAVGKLAKFTPPTVANGRVYMATFSGKVCVYGLPG